MKYLFKEAGLKKLKTILKEAECDFDKTSKNKDELIKIICDDEIEYCANYYCNAWWHCGNPKGGAYCVICTATLGWDCEKKFLKENENDGDMTCVKCLKQDEKSETGEEKKNELI